MIGRRRDGGRVRAVVAEMEEPRLAGAAAQIAEAALGKPGGVRQFLGNARRPCRGAGALLALGRVAFRQPDVLPVPGRLITLARHPAEISVAIGLEGADRAEAV